MREELAKGFSTYVATRRSRIVGFIAIYKDEVTDVFVACGFQGQGIGKQLLNFAKAEKPDGFWLETLAENLGARRFYEREGLRHVRSRPNRRPGYRVVRYEWQPHILLKSKRYAKTILSSPNAGRSEREALRVGDCHAPLNGKRTSVRADIKMRRQDKWGGRAFVATIVLSLSVILGGCFVSRPPALAASDLARPPDLVGDYTQTVLGGSSGQSTVRVTAAGDGSYRLTTLSASRSGPSNPETFRLLALGERSYLFIYDGRNSGGQTERVIYQSLVQEQDGAWLLSDMKLEPGVSNIELGFITENLQLAARADRGTVEVLGRLTAESLREFFTDFGVATTMTDTPSRRYVRTPPREGVAQ